MRTTNAKAPAEVQSTQVNLALHVGRALAKLAKTYPSIPRMILEFIQNSIDSEAKNIWVRIDFRNRSVIVRDDGDGSTEARFNRAINEVCSSIKPSGKLGKWGLGFISFIDKCAVCTYTSTPKSDTNGYRQWTFDCNRIIETAHNLTIDMTPQPKYSYSRNAPGNRAKKEYVSWRSEIKVERFHKDSALSRLSSEMLTENIQSRFSGPMQLLGTVVHGLIISEDGEKEEFEVKAKAYAGRRLQEVALYDKDAGSTYFRLFLAPRSKGYRGKVVVGEFGDPYTFEFSKFVKSCPDDLLSKEVVEALSSGIFEGEIRTSNAKLHPDRESFEVDDALLGFCITLSEWYKKHGSRYVSEMQEATRDTLNQQRGLQSLRVVAGLLKDPRFSALAEVVSGFKVGTVGVGHIEVDARKVGEQQKSLSITAGGVREPSDDPVERERSEPSREKEGHTPFTVAGPKGNARVMVKDNSVGLQFAFDGVFGPSNQKLWELDERKGILYFNSYHWLWAMAEDGGDKTVMRLMEFIAVQALHLAAMGDSDSRWHSETAFEQLVESYIFLLLNGDNIAGRLPGKRTSKKITEIRKE